MSTQKVKPLAAGTDKGSEKHNQDRQYRTHASTLEAQKDRILAALRVGPRTSYELRRDPVGSYQCPSRIHELRSQGYLIETHRVVVVDQDGFAHPRVAQYSLLGEPGQEVA